MCPPPSPIIQFATPLTTTVASANISQATPQYLKSIGILFQLQKKYQEKLQNTVVSPNQQMTYCQSHRILQYFMIPLAKKIKTRCVEHFAPCSNSIRSKKYQN